MNQRQAWLHLAKLWDVAKTDADGDFSVQGRSLGLCPSIDFLHEKGDIDTEMRESMLEKIESLPTVVIRGHDRIKTARWQFDATGAKQRAAFCRKQAARCSHKIAKRKKAKS